MKKKILSLSLIFALCLPGLSGTVFGSKERIKDIYLDVTDLSGDDAVYNAYAEEFNGENVKLTVGDEGFDYLPLLSKFDFKSLELTIELADHYLYFQKDLMFPENTVSVVVKYKGEETLTLSDELDNFVTSLLVNCPDAQLNGEAVSDVYAWIRKNDTVKMLDVYSSNAKLNFLFGLVNKGVLESVNRKPEYRGKMIFKIVDATSIISSDAVAYGESFYGIPSKYIAYDFDDADTAVFVYPVSSLLGTYANNGEAIATYTKVCVIDLHTMKMYDPITVVANEPPENLEITIEDGEYSAAGYTGEYEPDTAMMQIVLDLKNNYAKADKTSEDKELKEKLLPWYIPTENNTGSIDISQVIAAAAAAVKEARTSTEAVTDTPAETEAAQEETTDIKAETVDDQGEKTEKAESKEVVIPKNVKEAASAPYSWMTDEVLEQIFDALDDDTYKNTYNLIKNGRNLVYGSTGEAALGVQKTVIAFGQNITVDSSIGNSTLGALKVIQTALGQNYTDTITSSAYSLLMPALLIHLNEAAAKELLGKYLIYPDGSMFDYLKAGLCYINGKYYSAKSLYEESEYDNCMDMASFCYESVPGTGEIYRDRNAVKKEAGIIVTVNTEDENAATCVKIFDKEGTLISALLVKGTGTVSTYLPAGSYKISDGTGYRWYGITEMFGLEGKYENMLFADGTNILEMKTGYDYTIKFNVQDHSSNGYHIGSEESNWYDLID